jgi:hypothetical protein
MKAIALKLNLAFAAAALLCASPARAHQQWGDGSLVSESVKRKCSGDAEVHILPPGSVHALADGWHIDGFAKVVPYWVELPSPDGNELGFWSDYRIRVDNALRPQQSDIRCLFLNPRIL